MEHCYTERLKKLLSRLQHLAEIVLKINSEIITSNKTKQKTVLMDNNKSVCFHVTIRIAKNSSVTVNYSFLIIKDYSDEISSNINESNFSIELCNGSTFGRCLELSQSIFSNWMLHDITKLLWINTQPKCKLPEQKQRVKVMWYCFIILPLNFTKLLYVKFYVVSKRMPIDT